MSEAQNVHDLPKSGKYQPRRLRNGDIWRAAKIIAAVTDDGRLYHPNVHSTQQGTVTAVIGAAMANAPDELEKFLAELVGKNHDEFRELPFDATPEIIAEVMEGEDVEAFYRSAMRISSVAKTAFSSKQKDSSET